MATLIEVENLVKHFPLRKASIFHREEGKVVHAVNGISFKIEEGEVFGLVGESGCGKTTVGKLILRLLEPTHGTILFESEDIFKIDRTIFPSKIQMIFQDTMDALNPRKNLLQILGKPYLIHHKVSGDKELKMKVSELMKMVNLTPVEQFMKRYPHELSGGQATRVGIARALSLRPKFLVADEPVSHLDVSVRAGILEQFGTLKEETHLTILFISHDLAVVKFLCNRVAVMYLGEVVELANVEKLFGNPLHPYTKALLSSTPIPNPRKARDRKRLVLRGEVSSPIDLPSGCKFHPRCPLRKQICFEAKPKLNKTGNRFVACHFSH